MRDRLGAGIPKTFRLAGGPQLAFALRKIHHAAVLEVALVRDGAGQGGAGFVDRLPMPPDPARSSGESTGLRDRVEVEPSHHGPRHLGREDGVVLGLRDELHQGEPVAVAHVVAADVRSRRRRPRPPPDDVRSLDLGLPGRPAEGDGGGQASPEPAARRRPQDGLDGPGERRLPASVGAEYHVHAGPEIVDLEALSARNPRHAVDADRGELESVDAHAAPSCC